MTTEDLTIELTFAAEPRRVYDAWLDPLTVANWIWGSLGVKATAEVDARDGGTLRSSTTSPDGTTWSLEGNALQLDPAKSIEFVMTWSAPMGYETPEERVIVTFEDASSAGNPPQCRMTFRHLGLPIEVARVEHDKGWRDAFSHLAHQLNAGGVR